MARVGTKIRVFAGDSVQGVAQTFGFVTTVYDSQTVSAIVAGNADYATKGGGATDGEWVGKTSLVKGDGTIGHTWASY